MKNVQCIDRKIMCADGFPLAATLFIPTSLVKGAVLIGPATGVKKKFYANFARYLAENGFGVLTFDNRGIGGSLIGNIKNCDASLQCWGEQDMPAALEALKAQFPNTRYHLVGHSAGGQLIGLMHNVLELSSLFNVACSSGRLKNMTFAHRIKANFFMNIFIPLNNALFGYTNTQWVGMGEPLPKNAAKQWRDWCNGSGYVQMAFGKTIHQHLYNNINMPSIWINAEDDDIAINENVADMLRVFPHLSAERLTLSPKDYGLDEIGHMKFFSRKSQMLWPLALDWLNKQNEDRISASA